MIAELAPEHTRQCCSSEWTAQAKTGVHDILNGAFTPEIRGITKRDFLGRTKSQLWICDHICNCSDSGRLSVSVLSVPWSVHFNAKLAFVSSKCTWVCFVKFHCVVSIFSLQMLTMLLQKHLFLFRLRKGLQRRWSYYSEVGPIPLPNLTTSHFSLGKGLQRQMRSG